MFKDNWSDYNIDLSGKVSGQARVNCPECTPHRKKKNIKDLSVDIDKGAFHCFHCGWSGYLKKEGEIESKKKIYKTPKIAPKTNLPEKVIKWFESRGISEDILKRNKIGHGKVWMPQTGKEESAIQFPYYDKDILVNIKSRDGKKNFRMEKGAKRVLYGLNDINEFSVIVCEGEIDKLSFEVAGFKSCVSVPDGAPTGNTKNYSSKFEFLEYSESVLESVVSFVIATDGDGPGVKLRDELVRRLGAERCKFVVWPEGCKDANEVLTKHSWVELKRCVDNAKNVPVEGVFEVADIEEQILNIYDYGFECGESTGWKEVDKYYTVRAGEWSVITGIPGHGKSEFLDALTINLAQNSGWSIGMCSMENYPLERHFAKLVEKYLCAPFAETLQMQRLSKSDLKKGIEWFKKHYFFLMPEDKDMTIDGVLTLCKVLVYRHGVNGIVIDPWNELDHNLNGDTETVYISKALSKIRKFARSHRVHVWVVAHPTKLAKDKDGKYPVPTPYDIAGSSHWRNKADNAITVHRPVFDLDHKEVEIHTQKVRFKEIGKVGKAVLNYDYVTGKYL